MPELRITAPETKPGAKDNKEYDVELTEAQWTRYVQARQENRLHMTIDEPGRRLIITEGIHVKPGDISKDGAQLVEKGVVIFMGHVKPAAGDIDNKAGKRTK